MAVCCELTKRFEFVLRATLDGAVAHYATDPPGGVHPGGGGGAWSRLRGSAERTGERGGAEEGAAEGDLESRFAALVASWATGAGR